MYTTPSYVCTTRSCSPAVMPSADSAANTSAGRSARGSAYASPKYASRQDSAAVTMAEEPDSPAWRGMFVSYDSLKPRAGSGVAVAAQCS